MAMTLQQRVDAQSNILRQLVQAKQQQDDQIAQLIAAISELQSRPQSVLEEIDAYPGRRIESMLTGEVTFSINQQGSAGAPVKFQVNQDGPFIMTHYPMALWRPSAPSNATNFGKWRPVTSFPMPVQQITTDFIDLMYEILDGGSMRNFQNAPRGPIFSRPDNVVPCPIPTVFPPNSAIQFIPTYNNIDWAGNEVATTEGTLHVDFIGYRCVNL